ncbi:MAG: hypothetical protein ABSC36_00860 [Gaiellaceae bacterium]
MTAPRPLPNRTLPPLVASAFILLTLPVFLLAGWTLRGWALAAALWVAGQVFGFLLTRLPLGAGSAGLSAAVGLGMIFRSLVVGVALVLIAVSDKRVALAAALIYLLAFTVELALSLLSYFSAEPLG